MMLLIIRQARCSASYSRHTALIPTMLGVRYNRSVFATVKEAVTLLLR